METHGRLDPSSPLPLYHQLKERLRDLIVSGKLAPGDLMPSEYQLVREYGISRNTAKKAVEDLVVEGLLVRTQGKGTFVAAPKLEQSLTGFYGFSTAMRSRGITPRVKVVSVREAPASAAVAGQLGMHPGEQVTELARVRYADTEPIMLETSYMPVSLAPGLAARRFEEAALYATLADEYGLVVTRAKEAFEPVLIGPFESRLLGVEEGRPALLLDRVAYTAAGLPVEFCRSIVRGDRCRFYTELL